MGFFNHLSFHSIPESCNKTAKMLARFVDENDKLSNWLAKRPMFLLLIMITELV
jgi:hypothetical protein